MCCGKERHLYAQCTRLNGKKAAVGRYVCRSVTYSGERQAGKTTGSGTRLAGIYVQISKFGPEALEQDKI